MFRAASHEPWKGRKILVKKRESSGGFVGPEKTISLFHPFTVCDCPSRAIFTIDYSPVLQNSLFQAGIALLWVHCFGASFHRCALLGRMASTHCSSRVCADLIHALMKPGASNRSCCTQVQQDPGERPSERFATENVTKGCLQRVDITGQVFCGICTESISLHSAVDIHGNPAFANPICVGLQRFNTDCTIALRVCVDNDLPIHVFDIQDRNTRLYRVTAPYL